MSTPPPAATPTHIASLPSLQARYGERYRWLLLLSVMVGTMASIMSSTIVNVAIPGMSHHFGLGQERAQWVSSGFMVAMTVAMLTTPWLLSRYGYRKTYVGCMVLLMAGGIAGGLASQYWLVLAARVAEGLAAGAVQPIPAIIILRAFQPHEQGRASGIFGMGVVLAPAIGPSIGGVLVDLFGWRSIFFMVVPFCMASIVLAYKLVPTTAPGGVAASREGDLDSRGLLLATVGTLCLLNGLVQLRGDAPLQAALLLLGAVASVAAFLWWQKRLSARGRTPLMNLDLFSHRQFAAGSLVAFIYGTALFGSTYLLPVYMQLGLQLSASHVGTILLPAGIILALTIAGVGRLADRQPTRVLVSIGLALLAASFALMMLLKIGGSLWWLVIFATIGRIGLGFILPSLNLGSMRPLPKSLIAQGASAISFLRMLGGAAGVSLCAIVLEWRIAAHGDSLIAPATSPARIAAFDEVFALLAALCAVAIFAAWQLREPRGAAAPADLPPTPASPASTTQAK
ncbi:MAG: DHA2 family efflux MFS transporter permease subunit [Burkholderiaceae bacterium]